MGLEDLASEMLARGLSVRDKDAFRDENVRLLLSKATVSQIGERPWEDYQAFAQRDLSENEITYLFVAGFVRRGAPPPQDYNAFRAAVLRLVFGALIRAAEQWRPSSNVASSLLSEKNSIRNTRPWSASMHGLHRMQAPSKYLCPESWTRSS